MGEDAEVIIKIKGDSKDFNSKMAKLAKDYENKEIDMKITANDLEVANQKLKEMNEINDGIEDKLMGINNQIKDYENQITALTEKNATLNRNIWEEKSLYLANLDTIKSLNTKIEAQNRLATEVTQEQNEQLDAILQQYNVIDKIEGKYEKQKNDLGVIATKIKEAGSVDLGSKMEGVGKTINQTIKKVGKWALAIFGIRSAYMGIRRIMSGVLSQNEGLAKQMEGIRNSLYAAFTPIVEKIINLIKTLMGYVNAIWRKLFGHDLFKATSKSAQKTASAAKEINKQLAGFDEANVLSSNKSSGGVGGGGNTSANIKIPNIKLPGWLDKLLGFIKEHPKLAGIIFGTVAFTLFGLVKIGEALTAAWAAKLIGTAGTGAAATGATGLLGILSILALLAAAVWFIKLDYDALTELNKELDLLAESHARNTRWLEVIDEYQQEYNKGMEESTELTSGAEQATRAHIKSLIDEQITQNGSSRTLELGRKQLNETIKAYSDMYNQGKMTEEQEKNYAKFIRNNLVSAFAAGADGASQMEEDLKALDTKYNTDYTIQIQEHGLDDFANSMKGVSDGMDKLITKWKNVGDKIVASFGMTATQYKNSFHADGGIVNMPGRGVPINHIAGEAGREGIVPIDNESQMALLGSEIAKRVVINLTNITEMNGRTISRELNRINSNSSFLTNS